MADWSVFHNGRWYDPESDSTTAGSLVACQGTIVALGSQELSVPRGAPATVTDLEGRLAIPGPIDAHCHVVSFGHADLRWVDLIGCASIGEMIDRMGRRAVQPDAPEWVLGRGFDQERLAERRFPLATELDTIAPGRPVVVERICSHALVANTEALRRAGITGSNGLLTEGGMGAIWRAMPRPTLEDQVAAARHGATVMRRRGFTGVHCLIANREEIWAFQELHRHGELPLRVRLQIPYSLLNAAAEMGLRTGFGDSWLELGAVKLFSDGSLGARTAALSLPYSDEPSQSGELIYPPEELNARIRTVVERGCQPAVHAIGDRAVHLVLDAFEAALKELRPQDPRPRIEHASVAPPEQRARMADLGVVAAVQPQFIRSDFWTPQRLGPDRASWAYPFQSLLRAGVHVAGSTDAPVERPDPWAALEGAIHRDDDNPQEALSPSQALSIFTSGAAYSGFGEKRVGSLEVGKLADFVVLPQGMNWPPASWDVQPWAVVVDGVMERL